MEASVLCLRSYMDIYTYACEHASVDVCAYLCASVHVNVSNFVCVFGCTSSVLCPDTKRACQIIFLVDRSTFYIVNKMADTRPSDDVPAFLLQPASAYHDGLLVTEARGQHYILSLACLAGWNLLSNNSRHVWRTIQSETYFLSITFPRAHISTHKPLFLP